jgi:Na+:H+ antiporter, NhaA family
MTRIGMRSIPVYVLIGIGIWFGFHESGVHATIAGVILGLLTPARPWISKGLLASFMQRLTAFVRGDSWEDTHKRQVMLRSVEQSAQETISPLERLEGTLHPWVSFAILPLFALANAGVPIRAAAFTDSVAIAVIAGLLLGKPLGITSISWLAVRAGLAKLPEGVSWGVVTAGGVLAGIGFTMSLFIAGLALSETMLDAAKVGILTASIICALLGSSLLFWLLPNQGISKQSTLLDG